MEFETLADISVTDIRDNDKKEDPAFCGAIWTRPSTSPLYLVLNLRKIQRDLLWLLALLALWMLPQEKGPLFS